MRVGLMADLAVGAVKNGSEVVSNPELYGSNATVGAPADQFTDSGQNWDLPAIDPTALKQSGYAHFIDLMQSNMANCGALRIDHVMGLMRLWWWLENSHEGAYVYYPLEQLLAILRLESHRNKCVVIGEDLGVVSDEFRDKMAGSAINKSKLFFFETNFDGSFIDPKSHASDALHMVTNHDVPTLAGWWEGHDIHSRNEYNLYASSEQFTADLAQRQEQKKQLLLWLDDCNLLPEAWRSERDTSIGERTLDLTLCAAILKANARTHCQFMLYQLEDLQLIREPVNVPGTFLEHPNWQRKQYRNTNAIFKDEKIRDILNSIHAERLQ
jgi:4-alpha-glucanotransferase